MLWALRTPARADRTDQRLWLLLAWGGVARPQASRRVPTPPPRACLKLLQATSRLLALMRQLLPRTLRVLGGTGSWPPCWPGSVAGSGDSASRELLRRYVYLLARWSASEFSGRRWHCARLYSPMRSSEVNLAIERARRSISAADPSPLPWREVCLLLRCGASVGESRPFALTSCYWAFTASSVLHLQPRGWAGPGASPGQALETVAGLALDRTLAVALATPVSRFVAAAARSCGALPVANRPGGAAGQGRLNEFAGGRERQLQQFPASKGGRDGGSCR